MKKCDYGCGLESQYILKNGKNCCSKSPNSCPEMKRKNAKNKIGKNPFEGREHPKGMKGKKPWNRGLETNKITRDKISKSLIGVSTGIALTKEKEDDRRNKISQSMKNNPKSGGRRQGSGRGKQGWYKGFYCDSSWELAFVIYNLEHNIKFKRNNKKFYYFFNGEEHYWLPDFIIEDIYFEIKGYEDEKALAKHSSFKKQLKVLKQKEMKTYIEYVEEKYGKDYTKLYE